MNPPSLLLIVDDLAPNRETLTELLASRDYQIMEATDGPEALRIATETPPDLVLLDVMMPGMDGYEVCRRLRADPHLSEVPVIIVTALDDQASRLIGIEAGADDFITKPFNRLELRARVRTITRLNRYRRLMEALSQARECEARFQTLAEHSDEIFWFVALNPERTSYVSLSVEKIWALPASKFYTDSRLWEKAIHADDRKRVHEAYEAVLTGRAARFEEEYRVIQPAGGTRWVLDSGTPIRGDDGVISSIGGVARDITERKEADERMLRAQRLENIGMLSAGIAHDFNNALAPIVLGYSLLRLHVVDQDGLHLLDMMERNTQRSISLVRQLLSFARGASGQNKRLQLGLVLREIIELAEATFSKSITVYYHLPDDLWAVQGNETQIHQILLNLCVNARDAMPQGGVLSLCAANCRLDAKEAAGIAGARPGLFLTVEVRDSGTGIPPSVLARIWDPFFTTKTEGKGTGLGLSTVQGILHQQDGFITVHTREGHGTTFMVYLPAAEGCESNGEPTPTELPCGEGELILVADDEEAVRELTAQTLTSHGYRVETACDGAEAIAAFASRAAEVRLVLTDLQMPVIAGAALASVLRRLKLGICIVVMSGSSSNVDPSDCDFASAFLVKPFQSETLLRLIHRLLHNPESTLAPVPASHK